MGDRDDIVIVGAGILGLAVARELLARRPRARVVVLEQEERVGAHQTGHNSGVIHAGIYYAPGSQKAELCVTGAARMYEYCERRGVPVKRIGKLIIATDRSELAGLDELERRARANGVAGIRRVSSDELRELEPHARGVEALHSPHTGIVDFGAVSRQLADDVRESGGELRLGWKVDGIRVGGRRIRLGSANGDAVDASCALFCAGLWSDRLAVIAGAEPDPRIVPFRGAYLKLRPACRGLVRGLIYPVPHPSLPFLGVHLTPQIGGEVMVGPSALLVAARDGYELARVRAEDLWDTVSWPGSWRMATRWWRTGLEEMRLAASRRTFAARASRYVPGLAAGDMVPAFAGIRAQAVRRDGRFVDDFLLSSTPRALHVRNAPSPAATSSLALAAMIADRAERQLG